jgi:type II secretory pathway predicted ATPase ExeA
LLLFFLGAEFIELKQFARVEKVDGAMSTRNDLSDRQPAASGGFAGRDFFYSNLRIQEALTTIRYGIETRKGLIVVTGAGGAGKTTLLRKAVADLPAHILSAVVDEPRIDFSSLLSQLVRSLEADEAGGDEISVNDEPGMVRHCQSLLRSRLERCEIVALFIDDAQFLPDRTLRNLMQNFLGSSVSEGALLQIVLAGGQALKTKLSQAALVPLRRHRPIVCELQPLAAAEIAAYIERGLVAGERPADLFDERAVKRVALLTDGNPRAINALCERALQLSSIAVTAESIETAAQNLPRSSGASPTPPEDPSFARFDDSFEGGENHDERSEILEFTSRRSAPAANPAFFGHSSYERRFAWLPHGERLTSWVRGFTVLILIIGAAAMIPAQSVIKLIVSPAQHAANFATSTWEEYRKKDNGPAESPPTPEPSREAAESVKGPSEAEVKKMSQPDTLVPLAGPDRPAAVEEAPPSRLSQAPESPAPETPSAPAAGKIVKIPPEFGNRRNTARHAAAPLKDSLPPNRDLQDEVARAIASRAIMGVEVSVVRGTAILDGHVATERQRRAAERAALSVSGVERVRNRIAITFG